MITSCLTCVRSPALSSYSLYYECCQNTILLNMSKRSIVLASQKKWNSNKYRFCQGVALLIKELVINGCGLSSKQFLNSWSLCECYIYVYYDYDTLLHIISNKPKYQTAHIRGC